MRVELHGPWWGWLGLGLVGWWIARAAVRTIVAGVMAGAVEALRLQLMSGEHELADLTEEELALRTFAAGNGGTDDYE